MSSTDVYRSVLLLCLVPLFLLSRHLCKHEHMSLGLLRLTKLPGNSRVFTAVGCGDAGAVSGSVVGLGSALLWWIFCCCPW